MSDGEDFDGLGEVVEADAVDADAEAELGRVDAQETLYVALAGGEIAGDDVEDAESGDLIDGAELGLGPVLSR